MMYYFLGDVVFVSLLQQRNFRDSTKHFFKTVYKINR